MATICLKLQTSGKKACKTCPHLRPDPDYYEGTIPCCWKDYDEKHPEEFKKIIEKNERKG